MRVLLDTTYALRGASGTGVYLERLAAALRAEGVDVVEAADSGRPPPAGGGLGSVRNLARDRWWTQVALPRRAQAAGADVLHHPLPAHARDAPCAQVVTLHDLAFERLPECFDPAFRRWASLTHRRAARAADAVVCVSQTTRRDAMARWGLDGARIVVAPHGPGQATAPPAPAPDAPSHFLYIGDDEPRKNLGLLLAAHARYRAAVGDGALELVLAGRAQPPPAPGVRSVPDPDLPALLGQAAALVHPALHEGFGLTALEAMQAGVPVIAARSPGLAETCGEAPLYVDSHDADGLAHALARVAADPALRSVLAAAGRERAAGFSWRTSARAHIEAYSLSLSMDARATPSRTGGAP
ncbi:MAG: glycosyltransferase family 1 protein [Solirubrobacteraceae bacterium]|nr:glycosyltransferase family 1 protein [Solirubrobacteraceae bacterium]